MTDKTRCPFNYDGVRCTCTLHCAILEGREPRVRVKAVTRMLGGGVPDDAQPGDLVVGNRGAAAYVTEYLDTLGLEYAGNIHDGCFVLKERKVYVF